MVIGSGVRVGVKSLIAGVLLSHAFSGELKAVCVVNEAIQDGVAEGWVADNVVPMFDGDLAGDDGGGATVAIIEDQELNAADGFEQSAMSAVAASQGERLEQARNAVILDRTIIAAGFVAEGASNPAFAEPGCSGNE